MNRRRFLSMSLMGTAVGLYATAEEGVALPCACDTSVTNWYVPAYLNDAPNSYLQLYAGLQKIFKDGIVDRTDLAGACKNSPCMVDTLAYMTGAKINFKTLRIDPTLGASHIIHRISTNETYQVKLFESFEPTALKKVEKRIKTDLANKKPVSPADIDEAEKLADEFIYKLLHTDLEKLVEIKALKNYTFKSNSDVSAFTNRSDIVNKNVSHS